MTEVWTRRQFLQKAAATSLAPFAARLVPAITLTPLEQHLPRAPGPWVAPTQAPRLFGIAQEYIPRLMFLDEVKIGKTTDQEILNSEYPPVSQEHLAGEIVKHHYPSIVIPDRDNLVITQRGKAIFMRGLAPTNVNSVYAADYEYAAEYKPDGLLYGEPEAILPPPPIFNQRNFQTRLFAQHGFALVVDRTDLRGDRGRVVELQVFEKMSVRDYQNNLKEGDLSSLTPSPEPKSPSHRRALITVDGTGSDPRSQSFSAYDKLSEHYDRVESLTHVDYSLGYTIQDLFRMSEVIRDKVEELKRGGIDEIDFLTYSLGSVVTWIYLIREVAAPSGSHRDGTIRSYAALAGPISGVDGATLSYALSYIYDDTLVLGNQTTNLLAFWGSSDDRRRENENYSRTLREQNVRQMFGTNVEDCFIAARFATISGHSQIISMGRGENGIPDCDSIVLATVLPGNKAENIGHTQVLNDPRMVSQVTNFLAA